MAAMNRCLAQLRLSPSCCHAAASAVRALVALLSLSLALALAGCGPLHSGTDTIAYLRGGQLWVAWSDGTHSRQIAFGIVGYAWSPDHHELVYRSLTQGSLPPREPQSLQIVPDLPATISVASISGGVPLQISPGGTVLRSDAWWNTNGNRVVYRESGTSVNVPQYIVSQVDQIYGIARKPLLNDASLPALAADGMRVAVIDAQGAVRVGAPAAAGTVVAPGALLTLPDTGRPAHLLWRPGTDEIVYPAVAPGGGVALMAVSAQGGAPRELLRVPQLLDAAFSPDGNTLLVRTPSAFQLWRVATAEATPFYTWPEADPFAVPWWSPNSRALLIHEAAGWQLVNVAARTERSVLHFATATAASPNPPVDWRPAADSPWSPDGTHIVLAGAVGDTWQGKPLPLPSGSSDGLYVASYANGALSTPRLIASGPDAAPSWSTLDASKTFLVSA
jgi:hypothetical protein